MNNPTRRRPVRGLLSTLAVLSLTAAGLSMTFAPAASAANPATGDAAKTFVVNASGTAVRVYHTEESNDRVRFNFHNLRVGEVMSTAQDIPNGVRTSSARVSAWNSDEFTYQAGSPVVRQQLQGPLARTESPYPVVDAPSFSGGAYYHPRFLYDSVAGSTEAQSATGSSCLADGEVLSGTESTTRNFDYAPRTRYTGNVLDPYSPTSSDTVTVRTEASMYRLLNGRRGLRSEVEGSATTFRLLNQQVRVEIISGPRVVVENEGDTPTITTTGADISVTGPDSVTHRFDGVTGTLSYTDATNPSLSMTMTLNTGVGVTNVSNGSDFVNAGGSVTAVSVNYYDSSQTSPVAGDVKVHQLGVSTQVPNGGFECAEPDTDNDGLFDHEETDTYNTDPDDDDSDNDGLLDGAEVKTHLTDPNLRDTDGDQLFDGEEVNDFGTNPLEEDTDGDTLRDSDEVYAYDSNPLAVDTDDDGVDDNIEVANGTKPFDEDTDRDNLTDGGEVTAGTDPLVQDTDGDKLWDGDEVRIGSNPLKKDTDGGTVDDGVEYDRGTNPLNPNDDVPPAVVPPTTPTAPTTEPPVIYVPADSDNDGLTDDEEKALGTNPNSRNSDGDRLGDFREVMKTRTNPLKRDTDGDRLGDFREVVKTRTNPRRKDTDKDGLRDRTEVTGSRNDKFDNAPTNPRKKDTDRDGVKDLREIKAGSNPADRRSTPRHP